MKILVDIGNTRIKWCTDNNGVLSTGKAIEYKSQPFIEQLESEWAALGEVELMVISSVGANEIVAKLSQLAKKISPKMELLFAKTSASGFSVINSYKQPERLGVERWLGLIALRHFYPGNACIVDCGTAITMDWLDDTGRHLGGVISPGLQLMKQSLFKETSALSKVNQHFPVTLAQSTEPAIYAGTLLAATGLIEKSLNKFHLCETLVLTGGDALQIAEQLALKAIIEPDFILKGLSLYCRGMENK
jgi:type III pantothenate kinase